MNLTTVSHLDDPGLSCTAQDGSATPAHRPPDPAPHPAPAPETTPIVTHRRGQRRINLAAAVAQRVQQTERALDLTFDELCRSYLAAHYDGADMQLRKWRDLLGSRCAWDITTEELAEPLRAMLDNGYARATVNRNASQIGSVYKWAIKTRHIAPRGFRSPTLDLPRWDEPIRVVEVSDAQIARLVDAAMTIRDRRFAVLVRLLAETGARRGEVLERRWADFNLAQQTITVLLTKTGRPRVLTFSAATAELIARVWPTRQAEDLPFESRRAPGGFVNFKKHWDTITADARCPQLRMHDLRHHRAKKMIEAGAPVAVAAQALGHSSLILHRRYGHLEVGAIHAAVRNSWAPDEGGGEGAG